MWDRRRDLFAYYYDNYDYDYQTRNVNYLLLLAGGKNCLFVVVPMMMRCDVMERLSYLVHLC